MHRYLRLAEVMRQLQVDAEFLRSLEAEDLVHPKRTSENDLVVSAEDAERVRLARMLMRELEVNLAGVEVIMHMRESMVSMQQQFSEILEELAEELRRRARP